MLKKTVTLFSLACITFIITGPFTAWMIYKQAQPPGTFSNQVIKPGKTFSQTKAAKTLAVWGTPASLDIEGVQCKLNDQLITLEKELMTVDIEGNEAVLLFAGDYTGFDRISCEGGGLEQIHLSNRYPMDKAQKMIIVSLVATPLVGGFGIFLFRRTRLSK